ncbi:MAG: hypothetical protein Q8Q12_20800 [bacterium]|nr:hypothetical protein [bacterium]
MGKWRARICDGLDGQQKRKEEGAEADERGASSGIAEVTGDPD